MEIQEDTLWDLLKFFVIAGVALPLGIVFVPVGVLSGISLLMEYFGL